MRVLAAMVLGACFLLGGAGVVSAQIPDAPTDPSEADFGAARAAFMDGIASAERRRFRQALEAFGRSYRLSGSTVALFNLASTLQQLERYIDADAAVSRLLSVADLDAETRARALRVQGAARSRLAHLTILEVPDGEADVLVDGRVRAQDRARPLRVSLDPGLRVVRVELPGRPSFTWSETVGAGESVEARARYVSSTLIPSELTGPTSLPAQSPAQSPAQPPEQEGGANWGAVLGVGLGVLTLVAGVVLGIVLATPSLEPRTDLVIRLP